MATRYLDDVPVDSLIQSILVFTIVIGFGFQQAAALELPATGQTTCWDENGVERPCAGTGEDGDTRTGAVWPEPRFEALGDGTLKDRLTGLIWWGDASCIINSKWLEALEAIQGMNAGIDPDPNDNKDCSGGRHDDWRMPNINELASLMVNENEPVTGNWLRDQGFRGLNGERDYGYYWSSTTMPYALQHWDAWFWHLAYIPDGSGTKSFTGKEGTINGHTPRAWPVRGVSTRVAATGQTSCWNGELQPGPIRHPNPIPCPGTGHDGEVRAGITSPGARFVDREDGTFIDTLTNLVWLSDPASLAGKSWQESLDAVAILNTGQQDNWRMPNVVEMLSLVDHERDSDDLRLALPGKLVQQVLTNPESLYPLHESGSGGMVRRAEFWTSTTFPLEPGKARTVSLWDGESENRSKTYRLDPNGDGYHLQAWPVRDAGPPGIAIEPDPVHFSQTEPLTGLGLRHITVRNEGERRLQITAANIEPLLGDMTAFEIVDSTCHESDSVISGLAAGEFRGLAASESCDLYLSFRPLGLGTYEARLVFRSNDPDNNNLYSIALHGQSEPPAEPVLFLPGGSPVSFGEVTVGRSAQVDIVIRNRGTVPAVISQVQGPQLPFRIVEDNCTTGSGDPPDPAPLTGHCKLRVEFSPTAAGEASGSLRIVSNAREPDMRIALRGEGVDAAPAPALLPNIRTLSYPSNDPKDVTRDPREIDFGTLTPSRVHVSRQELILRNTGGASLYVHGVSLAESDEASPAYFSLENNECSDTIVAPGNGCSIGLVFSITETARPSGLVTDSVKIRSNDADNPLIKINLKGAISRQ